MEVKDIVIYGAGGFAREVAWLVESCARAGESLRLIGFVDDDARKQGTRVDGFPVFALAELEARHPEARIVGGVGNPAVRETLVARAAARGFAPATLVHPNVEHSARVAFGEGAVVCAGTTLTTNVRLGRHVQVNLHCTVGHDAVLDDFATLAPGVHVSGWVHIGRRAYIGTGAVLINGTEAEPLVVGDDAVVGAGACVIGHVAPGTTVVGVPARPVR